ncbi:MAG: hypothetical protein IPI22_11560 [Bacteroidetes bacterium]|nr:hypothetical protein [Bacteroidota bacterium]
MKKNILSLLFIFVFTYNHAAPYERGLSLSKKNQPKKNTGFDKSRLLLGPGIGAGAAYRAFSINLSPTIGYAFHENFNAGVTLGFNYFQQAEDYTNPVTNALETYKYKYPGYSFSVYGRYLLKNFLLFNFEPELNNVKFVKGYSIDWTTGKPIENKQRITIPSVLVGIGYMQRFGQYSYSFISLNYDLIQNPNSRYFQTLDYRFGVMIQLFN